MTHQRKVKKMLKKDIEVKIKLKLLERIAEYYEFPLAVFLLPDDKIFKEKTRNLAWKKKADKYDRIIEIIK